MGAEGLAETACCSHRACRPRPALNPPAAGQLETLHQALIECPAVKPALRWVGRLWVRIDGGSPPHLTPSVWIQGSCATWQPQASQRAALWHILRIAALAAVWGLRDRRVAWAEQFAPADVAESFFFSIRDVTLVGIARAAIPQSASRPQLPTRSKWQEERSKSSRHHQSKASKASKTSRASKASNITGTSGPPRVQSKPI